MKKQYYDPADFNEFYVECQKMYKIQLIKELFTRKTRLADLNPSSEHANFFGNGGLYATPAIVSRYLARKQHSLIEECWDLQLELQQARQDVQREPGLAGSIERGFMRSLLAVISLLPGYATFETRLKKPRRASRASTASLDRDDQDQGPNHPPRFH